MPHSKTVLAFGVLIVRIGNPSYSKVDEEFATCYADMKDKAEKHGLVLKKQRSDKKEKDTQLEKVRASMFCWR